MKVAGNPGAREAPAGTEQSKPQRRFAEVLNRKDQRPADSLDSRGKPSLPISADASAAAPAPPLPLTADPAPVGAGQSVAPGSDALAASLAREISVVAPPGGAARVDIQFDSRTLEGLHVRVQKTDRGVEVQFSTRSEAVSRLLTANAQTLTDALAQRGYVAPVVSVQRSEAPATQVGDGSAGAARDRRDRGDRGGSGGQGGGRNRQQS